MIDINDSEFLSRIEPKELLDKVCDGKTAAAMIQPGDILGISGFTPCGYPKITMHELAERMKQTPFQVDIWTGASTGSQIDGELVEVNGIRNRMPYQTNGTLRKAINAGQINYFDLHLSHVAQQIREGFFTNVKGEHVTGPDFAVIEACKIVKRDGEIGIVTTTAIGNSPVFVSQGKKVIIEVNTTQPVALDGMADIYEVANPPHRVPIPIVKAGDRIGKTYIPVDPAKIVAIVPCDLPDVTRALAPLDDDAERMGNNLVDFLKNEVKHGRLPENLLPLQSGVGNVANAVINGLVHSDFKNLSVYTEVIQDGMFDLIDEGKIDMISGTSLSPSPDGLKRFYANIEKAKSAHERKSDNARRGTQAARNYENAVKAAALKRFNKENGTNYTNINEAYNKSGEYSRIMAEYEKAKKEGIKGEVNLLTGERVDRQLNAEEHKQYQDRLNAEMLKEKERVDAEYKRYMGDVRTDAFDNTIDVDSSKFDADVRNAAAELSNISANTDVNVSQDDLMSRDFKDIISDFDADANRHDSEIADANAKIKNIKNKNMYKNGQ